MYRAIFASASATCIVARASGVCDGIGVRVGGGVVVGTEVGVAVVGTALGAGVGGGGGDAQPWLITSIALQTQRTGRKGFVAIWILLFPMAFECPPLTFIYNTK